MMMTGCDVTADRLMRLLDEERRVRWQSAMEEMDFTHSSRKSWDLLRKLGSAQPVVSSSKVTAKAILNNLFRTSNIKPSKQEKITINDNFKAEFNKCDEKTALMDIFLVEEVDLVWCREIGTPITRY